LSYSHVLSKNTDATGKADIRSASKLTASSFPGTVDSDGKEENPANPYWKYVDLEEMGT
jgi:hypothetical protein